MLREAVTLFRLLHGAHSVGFYCSKLRGYFVPARIPGFRSSSARSLRAIVVQARSDVAHCAGSNPANWIARFRSIISSESEEEFVIYSVFPSGESFISRGNAPARI